MRRLGPRLLHLFHEHLHHVPRFFPVRGSSVGAASGAVSHCQVTEGKAHDNEDEVSDELSERDHLGQLF